MSIWLYRKNREGKQEIYSATIPFEALFIALVLLVVLIVPYMSNPPQYLNESLLIVFTGFTLFVISKISLFRIGIWNSWGTQLMDKPYRRLYRTGYILMGVDIVIWLML